MRTVLVVVMAALPVFFSGSSCAWAQEGPAKERGSRAKLEKTGWLGVSVEDMTARIAKRMDVKTTEGALVTNVVEDSPAEKAGMKEDDVIIEFNGTSIADADDLQHAVRKTSPGSTVGVTVMRKNEKKSLQAEIAKSPRRFETFSFNFRPPRIPIIPRVRVFSGSAVFGLSLLDLNDQLGAYFEAPNGKGVLVEEVEKDSPAEKAGFKAGDVIVKVGKGSVEDIRDVHHALNDYEEGDTVDFGCIRRGAPRSFSLEVKERDFGRFRWFRSDFFSPHHGDLDDISIDEPGTIRLHRMDIDRRGSLRELQEHLKSVGRDIEKNVREVVEKLRAELRHAQI